MLLQPPTWRFYTPLGGRSRRRLEARAPARRRASACEGDERVREEQRREQRSAHQVNERHETHDVHNLFICDGSALPSSLGVNPQVTIMALALRAAQGIHARLESLSVRERARVAG